MNKLSGRIIRALLLIGIVWLVFRTTQMCKRAQADDNPPASRKLALLDGVKTDDHTGLRAGDPADSSRSPVVLKRIFANWKARQNRTKTFHFTWDERHFARGMRHWRQPQSGFWFAGERQIREEYSPFVFGGPKPIAGRVQTTFDGKTYRSFHLFLTPLEAKEAHVESIFKRAEVAERTNPNLMTWNEPLLLSFRPSFLGWTAERCRLLTENAIIGRSHYVEIEKIHTSGKSREVCWIDPRRDDVVAYYEGDRSLTAINYRRDPDNGWVPSSWHSETTENASGSKPAHEATVTAYTINEDFPPALFDLAFPAGTVVDDKVAKKLYFLRGDGSKRILDENPTTREAYSKLLSEDANGK